MEMEHLAERRYGLPGISLCSNKYKTKNLGVLNNVMFIGEPGGSNRSRGSDTIVPGASIRGNTVFARYF